MRRLFQRALVLAIVPFLGAVFLSGTASALPPPFETHQLVNENSDQCLTVQGPDNNAPAFQYTCDGLADQSWRFIPYQSGTTLTFLLQNANSGKCLTMQNHGPNTPAFQYDCDQFLDSVWTKSSELNGTYELQNAASGLCLVVQTQNLDAPAFSYTCLGDADQIWTS